MLNDIEIIFTDIDWTILNHGHDNHAFDMESIEALKKVQQKGILVYLCTARPYHSVKGCGILDIFNPDGIICTNGAVVFSNNKIIHNRCFPKEYVLDIIKVAHRHHLTLELSNEKDRWLTKKKNKYVDYYFETFHETCPKIHKYQGENISAVLLLGPTKYDETLKKEFPEGLTLFRFTDYGLDIHYHPVYKSEGINAALEYLNISKEHAMAIGDDYGDIAMFEAVKYSVCMGNGREEAKQAAKETCPHIDDHGLAKIIDKYFNI